MADQDETRASPAYALGQLAKAFTTSTSHEDPATRERARVKVEAWRKVVEGMLSGALAVGTRTPVPGAPAWATLEVVQGGFATGELAAAGPLRPHEEQLLARLSLARDGRERASLNAYFLSDAGFEELVSRLRSGRYRVEVPEEGALLVVAWLVERGQVDTARAVLQEIAPLLGRVRFFPVPHDEPLVASSLVHVQPLRDTVRQLEAIRTRPALEAQRETLLVWHPFVDRLVTLFGETVEGDLPALRVVDGREVVEGGWPCQRWPEGWRSRAQAALEDYARLRARHGHARRPERPTRNFAVLRGCLERCVRDPRTLSGRDVGAIRGILARVASKRGLPGSERGRALRADQARVGALPTPRELARVVVERLAPGPMDAGLAALEPVLAPVTADEAARLGVPAGHVLDGKLRQRLVRSLDASVAWLVGEGVIPSGEILARVIPQITSQVAAAGIADADLGRLYGAIYAAFRRRRSLLLVDLASQVKLEELPWIRAIEAFRARDSASRARDSASRDVARRTLEEVVLLTLSSWPRAILPNKLLQEVRALAKGSELELPIVDEVAADIFMGEFTEKYLRAAQRAAAGLQGSIYATYYGIDYGRVLAIRDVASSRFGAPTSPAFVALCYERANVPQRRSWGSGWVAENGRVIEQEQILTTHNLAVLVDGLGLRERLGPSGPALARSCFAWVCSHLAADFGTAWRARLHALKNSAYAWRQMVFFLSLATPADVEAFLAWAGEHLAALRPELGARLQPALAGLALAARGKTPGDDPAARVLLGWTTGKHWILG